MLIKFLILLSPSTSEVDDLLPVTRTIVEQVKLVQVTLAYRAPTISVMKKSNK